MNSSERGVGSLLLEDLCFWNLRDRSFVASSVTWLWPLANLQHILEPQLLQLSKQVTPPAGLLQDEAVGPSLVVSPWVKPMVHVQLGAQGK